MNYTATSINAAQHATLTALIKNDDRVAFYLKLYEYTGSKTALLMAQISSSSATIGGTAWAINSVYDVVVPTYPAKGVEYFSQKIAEATLKSIAAEKKDSFLVPSDKDMLENAQAVWEREKVGFYFPGNGLIALNHLAEGEHDKAREFASYAVATATLGIVVWPAEFLAETVDSRTNFGRSLEECLALFPGATVQTYAGGAAQGIVDQHGKTVCAFVDSSLDVLPLTALQQLRQLASESSLQISAYLRARMALLTGAVDAHHEQLIRTMQTHFGLALSTVSPLILDLDGDGVETLSQGSAIYFDHNGDGLAERTGWVGKDDGLLVRDLNHNGQIDHGGELFGNHSLLTHTPQSAQNNVQQGKKAANGFEALATLDSNGDGQINSADLAFNELQIWQDKNSNGRVDQNELLSLKQAGVKQIGLHYLTQKGAAVTDAAGNQHRQTGHFIAESGQEQKINDVWFSEDSSRTRTAKPVAVGANISALPNLAGMGRVHSLHQTLARLSPSQLQPIQTLLSEFNQSTDVSRLHQLT